MKGKTLLTAEFFIIILLTDVLSVILLNRDFHLRYRKDGAGRETC